jgi:molybdenum cofactor cytidylyltransferase
MAGMHVTSASIAAMGVGGLLMEIPTRPRPRENGQPSHRAGRSGAC